MPHLACSPLLTGKQWTYISSHQGPLVATYRASSSMPLLRLIPARTLRKPAPVVEAFGCNSGRLVVSLESTMGMVGSLILEAKHLPYGLLPRTATSVTTVPSAPGVKATSFGIRRGITVSPSTRLLSRILSEFLGPLRLLSHAATLVDA